MSLDAQTDSSAAIEHLKILIDSSTPIVVLETVEEMHAMRVIRQAASLLKLPIFEWTIASGLARAGSDSLLASPARSVSTGDPHGMPKADASSMYNSREPIQALSTLESISSDAVFILKDFHRHMEDPVVIRRLRDIGQKFSSNRRTVVITAPAIQIPPELENLVEFFELPLPDQPRLRQIIEEVLARMAKTRSLERTLDEAGLEAAANNLQGLTEEEADRAVSQALVTRYGLVPETVTDLLNAKKELLRRSGMLDFVVSSENLASVGGLDNLKHWLAERRDCWEDAARQFGLRPARGAIIMGVQGCGKSLCARAIAGEWKLPLVRFDCSLVFDKYIGETEKHIQKVFLVAERLAPCVLWLDELEKVLAGSAPDSASVDAGVSSRILAAFLSWMQDRTAPVFVAATSNNVTVLPPELIRKGRFDELFFVDLPTHGERKQIFAIQLNKRQRDPSTFDLDEISTAAHGFSGAEIDAAVESALYAAYSSKQAVSTSILLKVLSESVPLSKTRAEEIESLRAWARHRAVPASAESPGSHVVSASARG
ncbi:MAG: AAA family ATPase [Acidobacteria bacterium]|nr:AAA family ATPase [Acidobacteriota bacterium]